jgi:hypothetical protein
MADYKETLLYKRIIHLAPLSQESVEKLFEATRERKFPKEKSF